MWQSLSWLARSFRFRLTLWYVAILTLIALALGSYLYFSEAHALLEAFNGQLETRIGELDRSYDRQTGLLVPVVDHAPGEDNEVVLLLTPRGQIVQSFGRISQPSESRVVREMVRRQGFLSTQFFPIQPDGENSAAMIYGFGSGVMGDNQQKVFLVVGLPSDVPQRQQQLLVSLFLILPIFLLLATGGGFWLASYALRPVQVITRTARQIGESDLRQRLQLARRDELGELASTFNLMLDRLEAAFERQRRFTADASHELRTPLTIIDLEANQALTQPRTPEEYRQAIVLMQQENRAMARLVNDLLTLARADSGQAAPKWEEVDLSEVVLETVERLTPLAYQQEMTIMLGALPELVLVGDRQYLVQLVTNLTENALKYSAGASEHVHIEIGSKQKSNQSWVWLRVSDQGSGIAAEHLPHLFERFYRVDQSRTHAQETAPALAYGPTQPSGSGLGLSIARWIAEAHGGQIQVQSTEGQGSTFEVWLPTRQ
jgi:heavy metal sensor kinase